MARTGTAEYWVSVVEKAAYLAERVGSDFEPAAAPDEAAAKRLEQWRKNASAGDEQQFARRLAWDGLSTETAARLVAGVKLRAGAPLPSWVPVLQESVAAAAGFVGKSLAEAAAQRFIDPAEPCAFEELLAPVVITARRRLEAAAGPLYAVASDAAHGALERYLLQWMCAVAAEAIGVNFTAARAFHVSFSGLPGVAPSRDDYAAFVAKAWDGGLLDLYAEYPVMARLLGRLVELWTVFALDFLTHAQEDNAELGARLGGGTEPGQVVKISAGLSDRHNGGRTTLRVQFASGLETIYKPKDLHSEVVWRELLEWLNAHGSPLPLAVFEVISKPTHGWVEIVRHKHCQSREEVDRYYQRAGMLLCLIYVLEGSDCHHENIIASGEHPVLIDMETLLQHRVRMIDGSQNEDASSLANRVFYWDSVFRTALLPRWEFGPHGESYDISGLGGVEGQKTSFTRKAWKHINTDGMRLWREKLETKPHVNVVFLDGKRVDPATCVPQMLDGFEKMYRLLLEQKETLFAPGGPFEPLADLRLRFLFRHTKIYTAILGGYLLPQYLHDGMDASIRVDLLARPLLHTAERHPFWDIVAAEQAAILQGDIPIFHSSAATTALEIGHSRYLDSFFAEPSFELLEERFRKMGETDLKTQLSYIRASFSTPEASVPSAAAGETDTAAEHDFAAEARRIARHVREAAILSPDGSATWISLAYFAEAQRWQLQPMTPRLYDGSGGTILFLAAAERLFPGEGNGEMARAGLQSLAGSFDSPGARRVLLEAGVGAGLGAAALPYCLTQAALLLDDPGFLDAAESAAAALLTEASLAADRRFDLLGGSAGAVVALLTLNQARPASWLVDRAAFCGNLLLEGRTASKTGPRAWASPSGELLTGFSHGAAGIAYALARLATVTGNTAYREAALEAIAYEDSVFDEKAGNWPDFRFPVGKNGPVFQMSWCHGAPGVGLGRLALQGMLDGPAVERDLDRALSATEKEPFGSLDHLCCGNLGRAETLLVAARKLNRPEYLDAARLLANRVVSRADRAGKYQLGWDAGPYIPSFHQGMAGIGYQFLRLSRPDLFPSILLWE